MMAAIKCFTASTVCAVAGCKPVTLRAWQARNGLFPSEKPRDKWKYYSRADIGAVRVMTILTRRGFLAEVAARIAMDSLPQLERLFSDPNALGTPTEERSWAVAILHDAQGEDAVALGRAITVSFFSEQEKIVDVWDGPDFDGLAIGIDLRMIVAHVVGELEELGENWRDGSPLWVHDEQSIVSPAEAKTMVAVVAGAMAKVFANRPADTGDDEDRADG